MSIHLLPAPSIRALTSGQALTSPPSLIKELLDNSLDAHATHLSVELSANTLDVLQVKDNGHGIPPADRDAMAVRHCTSKIRDFSDIASCRTLGFRGEALASAAEMAGGMTITTRVEGEKVAVACGVDKAGAVVERRPVGAAVGTTVRVEGFLKGLPVRRENALKSAPKSITKLRALLQRYYLSHPHCRFSLRILAAPGSKGRTEDVIYAPSKSVPEAVQKAVGKDVAAACEWVSTPSSQGEDTEGETEQPIVLEAFLPKPIAPPAVIAKKPQCTNFVYVDSRAVSCARGTLKQVLGLYKTYLKAALKAPGVSDPFVYLNIRCPPGSYDPNIEPAKDDVMFHDAGAVLAAVEGMLKAFYGELKSDDNSSSSTNKGKAVERPRNGFEVLLARKPKAVPVPAPSAETPEEKRSGRPYVRAVQDVEYDEDEEELAAREMDAVMGSGRMVGVDSPPRGKMVQTLLPPAVVVEEELDQTMGGVEDVEEEATAGPSGEIAPVEKALPPAVGTETVPVTPRRKSTNWGFNMYGGADDEDDDGEEEAYKPMEPTASDNEETAQRDITISNPWTTAKLNSPIARSSPQRQLRRPFKPPSVVVSPGNRRSSRSRADAPISPAASSPGGFRGDSAGKARNGGDGNTGVMSSWISGSRRKGGEDGEASPAAVRKGFVSAAKIYRDNPTNDDDDDEVPHRRRPLQAPKRRRLNQDPSPADDPEPALASPPKSSPHKNRFLAATAALHSPAQQTTLTGEPPVLLPPPAQARRSKSRRRTKTLLPLETVPELVMQTHMLRCSVAVDAARLRGAVGGLRAWDGYVGGSAAAMAGKGEEGVEEVDDGAFWCEGGEREGEAGCWGAWWRGGWAGLG